MLHSCKTLCLFPQKDVFIDHLTADCRKPVRAPHATLANSQTHTHYWATAVCFGHKRWRGEMEMFSTSCQPVIQIEGWTGRVRYCLVVREWIHSTPNMKTLVQKGRRREGRRNVERVDVGQDDVAHRARLGLSDRLKNHQQRCKRCVVARFQNHKNSACKSLMQTTSVTLA